MRGIPLDQPTDLILRHEATENRDSDQAHRVLMACRNALLGHLSVRTRQAYMDDFNYFVRAIASQSHKAVDAVVLNLPWAFRREHAIAYRDLLITTPTARGTPPADSTVNRRLAVMSSVFREFVREGLVPTNPFAGLTAGYRCDPTPALSGPDRQKLVSAPDFEKARTKSERQRLLRDRCLLALLFVHGIRREEARLVKVSDVAMSAGYQIVTVKQKGGTTITHRLHPKLYHYIQLYRAEFMADDGYLFTGLARNHNSIPGQPLSPQAINGIVTAWAKRAGLTQHVTPHVGRATAITEALKKAPLQIVARSIGHASIESTARYDRTRSRMDQAIVTFQDCDL